MLGYKRVPGMCIYRCRIRRGGRRRPERKGVIWGKPANHGINQIKHRKNLHHIAEERVGRTCANMRVMNSYWVTEDGTAKWYEVVVIDPFHKRIREDPKVNWICQFQHKHREMRGLTSAGRKHRGLRRKGHKAKPVRPSRRAVPVWLCVPFCVNPDVSVPQRSDLSFLCVCAGTDRSSSPSDPHGFVYGTGRSPPLRTIWLSHPR